MLTIKAKTGAIDSGLRERDWSALHLALKVRCSYNTAKRITNGKSLSSRVIAGLLVLFAPATFEDLFEVVETDDED